ncbi:MAG: hypothetical protein PVJ49_00285 [Acidobacteriota bacterium]
MAGILLLVAMLAGCAGADDWVQTQPDLAEQARNDPGAIVAAALAQWDGLRGMVGSWQVRASRGINSRTLDTQIYLLRDALVQIEVMPPTMISEGFVGVSRSEVGLWVSDDPCLYRGPNVPGAFGRALGIDLAPEDIVAVLMGFAVPHPERATVSWDEAERRIRVAGSNTTAWLHPVTLRFERFTVSSGAGTISGLYEAWMEGETPVPSRMRVDVEAEGITLQLRLAPAWHRNPEGLEPEFFDQLPPVRNTMDCPLAALAADGGLLRRGLGR